jgi:hypothetical protein
VYAGAMIVLLSVALYLAGNSYWYAIAGLILEALFLLLLAVITGYGANEDMNTGPSALGVPDSLQVSMNSSIREMTDAVSDLFRLISQSDIRQDVLLTRLSENFGKQTNENTRKYAERLENTNTILREMNDTSRIQLDRLLEQQQQQLDEMRRLIVLLEKSKDLSS